MRVLLYDRIQQTRIHGKIFDFGSVNSFTDNITDTKPLSRFLEQSTGEFWQSLLKQDIEFSWTIWWQPRKVMRRRNLTRKTFLIARYWKLNWDLSVVDIDACLCALFAKNNGKYNGTR